MMHNTAAYRYGEGTGFKAVSLPYNGGVSLVAVLPDDEATFTFDSTSWNGIIAALTTKTIALTMPKVTIKGETISLEKTLTGLGMPTPFTDAADLSGIAPGLYIDDVLHQAFVAIDEVGTEAAAATAVISVETSAALDPVPFTLDRPFTFAIRDDATGAILFVGRAAAL